MKREKLHREEITGGMLVEIDGLECVETTTQKIQKDEHGIYITCIQGKHYIELDEYTDNEGYFHELFKTHRRRRSPIVTAKKRKHKVVVEITTKYAVTEKKAIRVLQEDLLIGQGVSNPIEKYNFKAFTKVLTAAMVQKRRKRNDRSSY